MTENQYERPLLVTILAILYALGAMGCLVMGVTVFAVGADALIEAGLDPEIAQLASAIGGMLIAFAIVYLILCFGFLKGWSIMWYLGVIFSVIGIIGGISSIVMGQFYMAVLLIIDVIILLYLFKSNVKLFFLKHE